MKIMKNGTIEPCCDGSKYFMGYFDAYNNIIEITVCHNYDEYSDMSIDFCPFCGVKTEVEK
jgi:hypothetical protein